MTLQEHLRNLGVTEDQVKECFNCEEAVIDEYGDIWIERPQSGHWLRDHEYESLVKFVEARL